MNRRNYLPTDRWVVIQLGRNPPSIRQQYHGLICIGGSWWTLQQVRGCGYRVTPLRLVGRKPRRKAGG